MHSNARRAIVTVGIRYDLANRLIDEAQKNGCSLADVLERELERATPNEPRDQSAVADVLQNPVGDERS